MKLRVTLLALLCLFAIRAGASESKNAKGMPNEGEKAVAVAASNGKSAIAGAESDGSGAAAAAASSGNNAGAFAAAATKSQQGDDTNDKGNYDKDGMGDFMSKMKGFFN